MSDIKFTILTPWLPPRESIHNTISHIDKQTYGNWEHLIYVDRFGYNLESADERRRVVPCSVEFNNWGNGCRHHLWSYATGDWILYLDDDDVLYPEVLQEVHDAVVDRGSDKDWGYFAIKLGPNKFFHYPPRGGLITGGQIFHRRILLDGTECKWYDNNNYGADFDLIYQKFVKFNREPILIDKVLGELPRHSRGEL